MRRRTILVFAVCVAAGVAGGFAWRHIAVRRAWEHDRPTLPAPAGARAPGLDARLRACAVRFAAYPPDEAALEEFSRVCHANGQLEAALAGYRVLARLQQHDGRWPYLMAVIHAGYGRLDEAVPLLRQATVLVPDHAPGWLRLGAALLKADDIKGATTAYEEALRRVPEDSYALVGLARCALREERWIAARGLLERAVGANPHMAPALHLLATVHDRLGNRDAAATVLARADAASMEVEPPDPWLDELYLLCHDVYRLRVTGASALSAGNLDRALAACTRAQELAPQDARVAWQFGRIYLRVGRLDEARTHFERAVDLDPDDDKAQLDLIGLLRQQGDTSAVAARRAAYESRFGIPAP